MSSSSSRAELQGLVAAHPHVKLASDTQLTDDSAVLVLRDEKTPTDIRRLTVEARDGGIHIEGWDLGDGVGADREYEWTIDIAARDVPALVIALGGASGDDALDAISRTCAADANHLQRVIVDAKIPHAWWHRLGD
jgi:hypothetical protein